MTRFEADHKTLSVRDTLTGLVAPFLYHKSLDSATAQLNSGQMTVKDFEWDASWRGRFFPDLDKLVVRDLESGQAAHFKTMQDVVEACKALLAERVGPEIFEWATEG